MQAPHHHLFFWCLLCISNQMLISLIFSLSLAPAHPRALPLYQ